MLVVFLFSINEGLITSIETVVSSIFCSNFPAEITTVPSSMAASFNSTFNTSTSPDCNITSFFTALYPIYLNKTVCFPIVVFNR